MAIREREREETACHDHASSTKSVTRTGKGKLKPGETGKPEKNCNSTG